MGARHAVAITWCRSSDVISEGLPERGKSSNPARRSSLKRWSHCPTRDRQVPRSRAMAEIDFPSAANKTMRARRWNRASPRGRRTISWRSSRSLLESACAMPIASTRDRNYRYRNLWRVALKRWEEAKERFFCPCQAAAFDAQGQVVSGPLGQRIVNSSRIDLAARLRSVLKKR